MSGLTKLSIEFQVQISNPCPRWCESSKLFANSKTYVVTPICISRLATKAEPPPTHDVNRPASRDGIPQAQDAIGIGSGDLLGHIVPE